MRIFVLAAALLAPFAASIAEARSHRGEEVTFRCPAKRLVFRAEVTDKALPEGWFTSRQKPARLVDLQVWPNAERGKLVLGCGYKVFDSVVWVRRFAPDDVEACKVVKRRFVCEKKMKKGGPIDGSFRIRGGQGFDLDKGMRTNGQHDVIIQRRGALKRALSTVNGSKLAVMGMREPTRRDCRNARFGEGRIDMAALRPGLYFCVETSEGRLARMRIDAAQRKLFGRGTLDFDYRTWRRKPR